MNKRKIKVKFMDFWKEFDIYESIFYQVLEEKYEVELCDDADYIIFSGFDDQILLEPINTAIKIFYIGENEAPNFNICDYAMGFEHMTLGDRYFRLPNYYNSDFYRKETELMEHKHEFPTPPYGKYTVADLHKTDFCSFVVSNARGAEERQMMFEKLNRYKKVNSGGRFLNNVGGPVAVKIEFESKHKFSICFDNCQYRGYTTEKIVEAFAARTVPIYWGDPDVAKVFNPKAFINVMDYPTIDAAIERIKEIDSNDDLYLSMLKEKALLDDQDTYLNTRKRLAEWLYHIIDQPIEKVRRTGNGFWQCEYYWRHRNYKNAYDNPLKTYLRRLKQRLF